MMSRSSLVITSTMAIAAASIPLWIYANQHRILYHPRSYVSEQAYYDSQRASFVAASPQNTALEEISYGGKTAFLIKKISPFEKRRLTFFFGGNAMLALDWLPAVHSSGILLRSDLVLVDFPGYGNDFKGLDETSQSNLVKDLRLLLSMLPPTNDVDVVGHSLGCAAALTMAADVLAIDGKITQNLMLISPFESVHSVAQSMFGSWLPSAAITHDWNNLKSVERLKRACDSTRTPYPTTITIMHGDGDEIVPFSQGRGLFKSIEKVFGSKVASFVPVARGDHNSIAYSEAKTWAKALERGESAGA